MIKYYVAETTPGAAVTLWKETRAKSLQGAKRAAQAARVFGPIFNRCTDLWAWQADNLEPINNPPRWSYQK